MTKPIDFDDLEATIDKTLEHLVVMRDALRSRDELVAIRQELGVAAQMQESILPTDFPQNPRYEIHASMIPAREVGGDFYDFFRLEDERMGIVVADVSGKGVPAALFMMVSRTLMKGTAIGESNPAKCLSEVNELLTETNEEAMFVTVFYTTLDPASGNVEFANAGHNLPYVINRPARFGRSPATRDWSSGCCPPSSSLAAPRSCSPGTCSSSTPTASTRRWTRTESSSATKG